MAEHEPAQAYACERWEIDLGRRELRADGALVPLGARAFEILEVLVRAPGKLATKDEIMGRVWRATIVDENALQVHMSAIRKAFGADRGMIQTVSGRGYRLLGDWTIRRQPDGPRHGYPATEPRPGGPYPGNLPNAVTELIGRAEARRQVGELLLAYRVVTLVGTGGIGKTRLGLAIAEDLRRDFADGAWFVDLSALADPNLVPAVAHAALGLQPHSGPITPERLARAIGDKNLLILLDNCEHVIDAAARMAAAIAGMCGRTSVLATSREPLRIEAERTYRVPPMSLPPDDRATAEELRQHSGVQLFLARAQTVRFRQDDRGDDVRSVAVICRRLDGIPLAIELAAATAGILGLDETIRRLDDRFGLLTRGRRTAAPRHRTLRAMLDWSHELLTPTERIVFRQLAVFAGGCTLSGACSVVDMPTLRRAEVIDAIAGLVTKSLVAVQGGPDGSHYTLLETVRSYALDKLEASGELDTAARRHAIYCIDLSKRAQEERFSGHINDWLATYRREIENIRTALDWAFSDRGDPSIAVELSANCVPLMYELSLIEESHARADKALALCARAGSQLAPRFELSLRMALQATQIYISGPSESGMQAWQTILDRAILYGDGGAQARALWGLWNDHIYCGKPAAALIFAKRYTAVAEASNQTTRAILGSRLTGICLHYQGDQIAARTCLEQVLEQYVRAVHRIEVLGSRLDQATVTRATLVRVLWLQGEPDSARNLLATAMNDAIEEDHIISTLYVLVEAAIPLSLSTGDLASAEHYVNILLDEAGRSGFRIWQIYARCLPEVLRIHRGDFTVGLKSLADALGELHATGFCVHLSMFMAVLAGGYVAAGRPAEALAIIKREMDRTRQDDQLWFDPELLRMHAEIFMMERSETAFTACERDLLHAIDNARHQGELAWELRAATTLARLYHEKGEVVRAVAVLSAVYDRFKEGFGTQDLLAARALLDHMAEL